MDRDSMLLCRARARLCALPLAHIVETMRPLPLEPLRGTAPFVRGVSIVRGVPIPVVDLGALLGLDDAASPTRLLTVRIGTRHVALAVEAVVGIREVEAETLKALPPLLGETSADAVAMLGALEGELLLILRAGRLVPDSTWDDLDANRELP